MSMSRNRCLLAPRHAARRCCADLNVYSPDTLSRNGIPSMSLSDPYGTVTGC